MQFTIIRNPSNMVFKYEVWYKGESDVVDSYGQVSGRKIDNGSIASSFLTIKGAEGFIQYQNATRSFRGAL